MMNHMNLTQYMFTKFSMNFLFNSLLHHRANKTFVKPYSDWTFSIEPWVV